MANYPVVRISKGRFAPSRYKEVFQANEDSAQLLIPALKELRGLLYYSAGVDQVTNTMVNISIWTDLEAAKQMDTLAAMLAQRPIMVAAGVQFNATANYEPAWALEANVLTDTLGELIPLQK